LINGIDKIVEETLPNANALFAVSKGMQASNKILQFLTGDAGCKVVLCM